jgi:glycosyltransferase involved in cell wall biosynthesis
MCSAWRCWNNDGSDVMKILIAVHHFPPTFGGGAEWRAYRTARGLQEAGHQVRVVCVDSVTWGDGQTLEHTTTSYDGVDVRRLSFNLEQATDPFLWSYCNPLVGEYVSGLLDELKPDLMHLISGYLMSGSTVDAAVEVGVPVVLTLTDYWFLCPRITLVRSDNSLCTTPADPLACALCIRNEKRRYRLPDRLTGGAVGHALSLIWKHTNDALIAALSARKSYLFSLFRQIDTVISPSKFLKELFESNGISTRRFIHMRQGLDLSNWGDTQVPPRNSRLRFGYIGQIARHKGVDTLVDAFKKLRAGDQAPRLTLYGDHEQFPRFTRQLRKQVANRSDIVFAGRFEYSSIGRIHDSIDVLVVPSVWYENSPNVILEAYASRTPVVVSRLGGMAELVAHGESGFHFEAGNAQDLASVLQRFVDQPRLAETLGRGSPAVKTVNEEVEELIQVYATLEAE